MITPIELQSKTFKTGIGYEKKEVENFLNSLLVDYESLYKDNMELNDKINVLSEGINYYKSIEKTLQKALVLAEKTAEETKEAAVKQARGIEDEAKGKAQIILADANNELQRLQQQIILLATQYDSYKAQFKHLAAAQCEFLDSNSFQIHMTDLNPFSNKKENESSLPNMSQSKPSTAETNDKEVDATEDDFEFYNINEDA